METSTVVENFFNSLEYCLNTLNYTNTNIVSNNINVKQDESGCKEIIR